MMTCPKCNSNDVHRSRAKTRWETWRKEITAKRPFRCHACGWRGWRHDTAQPLDGDGTGLLPDPPNLAGTGFGRDDDGRQVLDLDALDKLDPAPVPAAGSAGEHRRNPQSGE